MEKHDDRHRLWLWLNENTVDFLHYTGWGYLGVSGTSMLFFPEKDMYSRLLQSNGVWIEKHEIHIFQRASQIIKGF